MRDIPKPYEIYRHFKGRTYQVLTLATHSETGEQLVIYQQLYEPYGVYARPLAMFMSAVDRAKYPDAPQEYRFEKIEPKAPASVDEKIEPAPQKAVEAPAEATKTITESPKSSSEPQSEDEEFQLDAGLLAFLEADTYERKLEILSSLHATITDEMIDTMAVSLDIEVADGDIERRYSEILNCLLTMERFECNRLR